MNTAENPLPEKHAAHAGPFEAAELQGLRPLGVTNVRSTAAPTLPQDTLVALLEDHQRTTHHTDVCEICRTASAAIAAAQPQEWRVMLDRESQDGQESNPLSALMARIDDTWTHWERMCEAKADVRRMLGEIEAANGGAA